MDRFRWRGLLLRRIGNGVGLFLDSLLLFFTSRAGSTHIKFLDLGIIERNMIFISILCSYDVKSNFKSKMALNILKSP